MNINVVTTCDLEELVILYKTIITSQKLMTYIIIPFLLGFIVIF